MKRTIRSWSGRGPGVALAMLVLAAGTAVAQDNGGTGGRARVLVAPLQTDATVKKDFGKKVSEEVRSGLESIPTLVAIDWDQVKEELRRLKLKEEDLGLIQWRQLAGRLNADVVMTGTVASASSGNQLAVSFVDSKSGDEVHVPPFSVAGDGKDEVKQAAGVIVSAFGEQVDYRRALLFCQDYLAAEQFDDALRNCDDALQTNQASTSGHYLRGRVYMGQENWAAAAEDLQYVIDNNPAEVDALNALAYVHAQMGDMTRAVELYREYLNFNPGDASVRMTVAFELAQAGGDDEAIELLQEGIEIDPSNADLWEFLGNVALKKGTTSTDDLEEETGAIADEDAVRLAVEAYDHVLELKGEEMNPEILRNVIAANLELGDYDAALAFADRAQTLMPQDAGLWSIRSDIYGRMERYDDAIAALDRALALDPAYPNAYLRRGFLKLRAGDSTGGTADLRMALDQGADVEVVAGQLLARGYNDFFKAERYDEALAMFEVGTSLASAGRVRDQLYFFTAYGYYQQGVAIDKANESAEACQPARRALSKFQQVLPNLDRAGSEQPQSQAQIRESTDVYIYRQEQIIRKNCGG
ncbi:MAG: tetratricopeptide repeat protein [Candidatus Palauibacterales bacterium]|nr:tetratricopeptide repeat protein [Candidatus Palauibacterales bacterium]